MTSSPDGQPNEDQQYRTLLTLWGALLMSVVTYFLLTLIIARPAAPENRMLPIVFSALSVFLVVVSFAVKSKLLSRAIDSQDMRLVRIGSVVAWAICETSALFGLIDFLLTTDRYYFVLMAVAFIGILLHFPRRSQLLKANFMRTHTLNQ
jgi:ABC-type uncharacterized transport system permease subunit